MKTSIFTLILLLQINPLLHAAEVIIKAPNGTNLITTNISKKMQKKSLGEITSDILIKNKLNARIDLINGQRVFNTISKWAPKTVSNADESEVNSMGWCYKVNNQSTEKMPDQVKLQKNDVAVWYYGRVVKRDGEWQSDCKPVVELE